MRIDAHQHYWRLDRGDYGWITPDLAPLYRDFGPADLASTLDRCGISRTILVQAAPTAAETQFLLDLALANPNVAGVVGWTALDVCGAEQEVARLGGEAGLVGLRPMLQDIPDERWILRDDLSPAVAAMIEHDLRFDALVVPRHLEALRTFLLRWPDLQVVIDHGAKPDIAAGEIDVWRRAMRAIAEQTGAFCKVSGLITEAAEGWGQSDLAPYLDSLLEMFGPERLMWGSDWPVLNLRGSYERWLALCEDWAGQLTPIEREAVFGGNAARFYGVG